jgi:hypothetical protein
MLAESGFHTRAFVEWEACPRSVLVGTQRAGYFAPAPIWDDLRSFDARPFREAFDAILAGYPCQPFSAAGKRGGADDPFLALSGASALRRFYTSGLIMHRPDEDSTDRRLEIELRNGPALPGKLIDKAAGRWVELNPMNERLVRKEVGAKLDAERLRKHDVILGLLLDEAAGERLYTAMQFAETFENRGGLGSKHTIRERLSVLATKGFVKFLRDPSGFCFPVTRSRFGYLCVEGMQVGAPVDQVDPTTGEVPMLTRPALPSHFKCPQSGLSLQVENPAVWVYPEGLEDDLTHMSEA